MAYPSRSLPRSFGYSCLTSLPDGSIGCLYEAEGASRIVFARVTLDWLTQGKARSGRNQD